MHHQKKDILKKLLQRIARSNVSRYPTIQKIHISDGYVLEYKRREGFPSPSDPNRTEYALFRLMSYDDELALFEDADDIFVCQPRPGTQNEVGSTVKLYVSNFLSSFSL